MRPRQMALLGTFVIIFICAATVLRLNPPRVPTGFATSSGTSPGAQSPPISADNEGAVRKQPTDAAAGTAPALGSISDRRPRPAPAGSHPMWQLIKGAEQEMEELKARQSKTLKEAVAEYRRRYGMHPPPKFDKWYKLAVSRNVRLIDEFDGIHEMLKPFWGLKPSTIRKRAKEALAHDNSLLGMAIRNGKVTYMEGGREWMRNALEGMVASFIEHLPSMDLAFNIHDEPRVIVPYGDLERLVARGSEAIAANGAKAKPQNNWTKRPAGLSEGTSFGEIKTTHFNVFSHQPTWTCSRLSCPLDSPARALEEDERWDNVSSYGLGELGFVYNATAMSDICQSPSLESSYGFFDRPNAYSIVQDLLPIFSQSKISTYADILYPSPWYWVDKVPYNETQDFPWPEKEDRLYWRGSTTGGYSREGSWRRHHRQRFVQKINGGSGSEQAKIFVNKGDEAHPNWQIKEVARGDYRGIVDVFFSHIGQCDPGDCDAQAEYFDIKERAEQHDAWRYKYLLDMDGNAFSGRFYAFLRSRSLVFKLALFREWHAEWLRPWAHYIPLSFQGDDWLEAVRFFGDGTLGKKEAERLALQGRDWANQVLRNEDLEIWFFRLLLE